MEPNNKSKEISEVCKLFNLGEPLEISRTGGTRNLNLVVVSAKGKWLVKMRHPDYCSSERISFDHSAISYLGSRMVPVAPLLASNEGKTWCDVNGNYYEVHGFVEGENLKRGDERHLIPLAEELANFHAAGREFQLRFAGKGGGRGETGAAGLSAAIEQISASCPGAGRALSFYGRLVELSGRRVSEAGYDELPVTLVHGDLQPANIIHAGSGRVAAFVDFDWCGFRPKIYDIAFALLFCCSEPAEEKNRTEIYALTETPRFMPGKARRFLDRYEENAGALPPPDKIILPAQIVLTLCHSRLHGALKVAPPGREEFLARGIDSIMDELAALNGEISG